MEEESKPHYSPFVIDEVSFHTDALWLSICKEFSDAKPRKCIKLKINYKENEI